MPTNYLIGLGIVLLMVIGALQLLSTTTKPARSRSGFKIRGLFGETGWGLTSAGILVLIFIFGGWIWFCLGAFLVSFAWVCFKPKQMWVRWSAGVFGILFAISLLFSIHQKDEMRDAVRIEAASQTFSKSDLVALAKARGKIINPQTPLWEGTLGMFDVRTDQYVAEWSGQEIEILVWTMSKLVLQMKMQDGSVLNLEYDQDSIDPKKGRWVWSSKNRGRVEGEFTLLVTLSGPSQTSEVGGIITSLPLPKGQTGVFPALSFRFTPNEPLARVVKRAY